MRHCEVGVVFPECWVRVSRLSFFGLGAGGAVSDVYNQNDNPINPYSQFSDGTDAVYTGRSPQEVERRKKALNEALVRFEKSPEYIKTKQAQNLKSNLLVATSLKQDMLYFSGAEGSPAYTKAREFSQQVSTMGVDGNNKQWPRAEQDHSVSGAWVKSSRLSSAKATPWDTPVSVSLKDAWAQG